MATKEEILKVANKGNWDNHSGENRCIHCGKYQFECQHEPSCPLGILLMLVEVRALKLEERST